MQRFLVANIYFVAKRNIYTKHERLNEPQTSELTFYIYCKHTRRKINYRQTQSIFITLLLLILSFSFHISNRILHFYVLFVFMYSFFDYGWAGDRIAHARDNRTTRDGFWANTEYCQTAYGWLTDRPKERRQQETKCLFGDCNAQYTQRRECKKAPNIHTRTHRCLHLRKPKTGLLHAVGFLCTITLLCRLLWEH